PGTPRRALGNADQHDAVDIELVQYRARLGNLSGAAIDQQDVRQHSGWLSLGSDRALEAPAERLVHRRVVVTRLDPGDVETAVLPTHRAFGIEYHARGD